MNNLDTARTLLLIKGRLRLGDLIETLGLTRYRAELLYEALSRHEQVYRQGQYLQADRVTDFFGLSGNDILNTFVGRQTCEDADSTRAKINYRVSHYAIHCTAPLIALTILQSLHHRRKMEIRYVGLQTAQAIERKIQPIYIHWVHDRWHLHAYCELRQSFRNFIISRFLKARMMQSKARLTREIQSKKERLNQHTLLLRPHRNLSPDQRNIVEKEYGMQKGYLRLNLDQDEIYYFKLRHIVPEGSSPTYDQVLEQVSENEQQQLRELFA